MSGTPPSQSKALSSFDKAGCGSSLPQATKNAEAEAATACTADPEVADVELEELFAERIEKEEARANG